ncbi:MAG: FAD-dependent oxidoreductase [Gorillibacterium sp.]|nr:FAD-dependent oxidoreductase [Gorillibacterium sp.]
MPFATFRRRFTLAFSRRVADTFVARGGTLSLGTSVREIVIEKGRVTGVNLAGGQFVPGDYVVPATDIHTTLEKLLGNAYPLKQFTLRDNDPSSYPLMTSVHVALAVDDELKGWNHSITFTCKPFVLANCTYHQLSLGNYAYEPSFSPPGSNVLTISLDTDYDYWKEQVRDRKGYKAAKENIYNSLFGVLEDKFPQLKGKITGLDIATPLTYERYCDAYRGSWMSYIITPKSKNLIYNGKIKGVKNLYMAGQWLMPPGGLPVAAMTGKWAIERIKKQEKIR